MRSKFLFIRRDRLRGAVSIVAKLTLVTIFGAIVVTACIKLAATRNRNARLTETRYIAPFRYRGPALTAAVSSTSPATISWRSGMAEPSVMGS